MISYNSNIIFIKQQIIFKSGLNKENNKKYLSNRLFKLIPLFCGVYYNNKLVGIGINFRNNKNFISGDMYLEREYINKNICATFNVTDGGDYETEGNFWLELKESEQ